MASPDDAKKPIDESDPLVDRVTDAPVVDPLHRYDQLKQGDAHITQLQQLSMPELIEQAGRPGTGSVRAQTPGADF